MIQGFIMNKKTIVKGFGQADEPQEELILNIFNTWMADWMNNHPAALNLTQAKDTITTMELMHQCFLETSYSPRQDELNDILQKSEYIFESGAWLVR